MRLPPPYPSHDGRVFVPSPPPRDKYLVSLLESHPLDFRSNGCSLYFTITSFPPSPRHPHHSMWGFPSSLCAGAAEDEGYQIGGVGGHGAAIGLEHDLGVAVVGGDHGDAAHFQGGLHHPAHARVHRLHGLDGGLENAGVAHHVAVGEVQDDDVIRAGVDALDALVADLPGAHLGLEVVGGHLGGGHQHPVLAGVLLFHAAVEEEGDVGVLLRFGDAQLGHAHGAEVLAQAVFHRDPGPGHQHIGHGGVVLGVADVGGGEILPLEAVEIRVHNGPGDLPGPVGTEVEENDAVIVGNRCPPSQTTGSMNSSVTSLA